ncbi:YlxR family protein [Angustibacter peucedani]
MAEVDGEPTVVHDPRRALPGRGAWLHPDPDCWTLAQRRSALTRALRTGARVDQVGIAAAMSTTSTAPRTSPSPSAATRATGSGSER